MEKVKHYGRSIRDLLVAISPTLALILIVVFIAYKYIDPAPPKHFVIATGDGDGDYQTYAKLYRDIIKEEGIDLEIRPSKGAWDNLKQLKDPNSDVTVGFIEDGLGSSEEAPELSSLGSLYYEPIWVFYRSKSEITRFSQLIGKKLAIGEKGGGTHTMAKKLLKASGIDDKNAKFIDMLPEQETDALKKGQVDAAFFMATADDPLVTNLVKDNSVRLMSVDQAEAITRQIPFLHHVVLPHGAMNLKENVPNRDVDLVSPTATLVVKDTLHPALVYLLLKAASQVHGDPGMFETKNEFPIDRDYAFPLSDEAKTFYKSGLPFWQRYLPFWLAILFDRFILLALPAIALILPVMKLIPRYLEWRVKSRIYQRYGELKFLETQIHRESATEKYKHYLVQLEKIEERVNHMKIPLDFTDYVYHLKEHIHFVRERLDRYLTKPKGT